MGANLRAVFIATFLSRNPSRDLRMIPGIYLSSDRDRLDFPSSGRTYTAPGPTAAPYRTGRRNPLPEDSDPHTFRKSSPRLPFPRRGFFRCRPFFSFQEPLIRTRRVFISTRFHELLPELRSARRTDPIEMIQDFFIDFRPDPAPPRPINNERTQDRESIAARPFRAMTPNEPDRRNIRPRKQRVYRDPKSNPGPYNP